MEIIDKLHQHRFRNFLNTKRENSTRTPFISTCLAKRIPDPKKRKESSFSKKWKRCENNWNILKNQIGCLKINKEWIPLTICLQEFDQFSDLRWIICILRTRFYFVFLLYIHSFRHFIMNIFWRISKQMNLRNYIRKVKSFLWEFEYSRSSLIDTGFKVKNSLFFTKRQ